MSDDGFKLVTPKRRGRKPAKAAPARSNKQGETDICVNSIEELQKIEYARTVLNESLFIEGVKCVLQEALDICGAKAISEIICYGLGHFTECNISRYQLALLLSFKEKFIATVYAHDPVFHNCELKILRELGFLIIEENEEGKRVLCPHGTTLVYLPHCPKQLVNNFLWKNWGPSLKNCIIFGNSFNSVIDRRILSDSNLTTYLAKIQPYMQELTVINNFKFLDVFNDTSVHVFPEDKLSLVPPSFWTESCEEPVYPDSDLELIVKKS